ncbi:MAG TPA: serine/threonine-protein kinase [Blastocatellia bacterium]|nr:serine/threonine-protein kinase [Blastocatellia bacterium]
MSPERYRQVKALFQAVLDVESPVRATYLQEACGDDAELRQEVESLLASHDEAGEFIETPAAAAVTLSYSDAPSASSAVGQRIGPYQILREIGHGGMGAVYLATRADDQYKKRVAIKLVRHGMGSDFIVRRFRHERQILASLDHPNIARLLDGGTTEDGAPYFVMEYIKGLPMDEYCDRQQLTTAERLQLFRTVCAAVQYAHQNLVVHRDLKPSNILITSDGTVKLLDFGIAKLLNPELVGEEIDATMTGMRLMTPGYASPEQVRAEPITTASDVYSLGVILYELLTGHRPYHVSARPPHEVARVICESQPTKPSDVVIKTEVINTSDGTTTSITPEMVSRTREGQPDRLRRRLSGDLDNIVLMAMRKEPQRRYTSVSQLAEDLRRHLEGLPVIAREDTFGYRTGKFVMRHKAGVAAAALITIALIGGMATTLWQARKAERRFNDVRKLANSFLFEFHDAIEKLPGSTPARALVVKRALEYLDSLAQEASNDSTLQQELAAAYDKVGHIQGNPYSANLGDIDGALQSYQKARAIRAALLAQNAAAVQVRIELAGSHRRISDILMQKNEAAQAMQNVRQSLQLLESLPAQELTTVRARSELAASYEALGAILRGQGDNEASLEQHQRGLQMIEALAAQEPNNLIIRRQWAVALGKVGERLSVTGAKAEGVESARKSLAVFAELAAAQPNNAQAKRELSVAHNQLGDLFYEIGDLKNELEHYRQSLALREELVAADPANQQLRRDLAVSQGNVGYALAQMGDEAGMVENYRKSLATFEAMSAANPKDAFLMRDLAAGYDFFAQSWKNLATFPGVSRSQQVARWQQARQVWERGLKLAEQMKARGLLPGQDANIVEKLKQQLSECDSELAKLKGH